MRPTQRGIVPKCVRFLIFMPILSGLIFFSVYSCDEPRKSARKGTTYMRKLITIILALIMTLFSSTNQGSDQPPVTAEDGLGDTVKPRLMEAQSNENLIFNISEEVDVFGAQNRCEK